MHLLYCIFSLIQYISVKSLRLFFCFSALVKLHLLHRCLSTFVCRCVKLGLLNHVTYCFYWEIEKICLLPDLLNADCVPVNVVTKPPSSWDSLCSLFVCVIYSMLVALKLGRIEMWKEIWGENPFQLFGWAEKRKENGVVGCFPPGPINFNLPEWGRWEGKIGRDMQRTLLFLIYSLAKVPFWPSTTAYSFST